MTDYGTVLSNRYGNESVLCGHPAPEYGRSMIALRAALASLVVLVVPAVAQAGIVSTAGTSMTFSEFE